MANSRLNLASSASLRRWLRSIEPARSPIVACTPISRPRAGFRRACDQVQHGVDETVGGIAHRVLLDRQAGLRHAQLPAEISAVPSPRLAPLRRRRAARKPAGCSSASAARGQPLAPRDVPHHRRSAPRGRRGAVSSWCRSWRRGRCAMLARDGDGVRRRSVATPCRLAHAAAAAPTVPRTAVGCQPLLW